MATKYESYIAGDDNDIENSSSTYWMAQTFTPSVAHKITGVKLLLYRSGSGALPGTVTVSIRASTGTPNYYPTGSDIDGVTGTTNGNTLPVGTPYEWREITLSGPIDLAASTQYAIVVRCLSCDINNMLSWRVDTTSATYTGGIVSVSTDGGSGWSSSGLTDYDFMFEDWGDALTVPTVTIQTVTSIQATTATGNGNLTATGDPTPTQHGHCWNTTGTPTTTDNKTTNGAKATTGAFTSSLTSLVDGTLYYVRAYATNVVDTVYSEVVQFRAGGVSEDIFPTDAITRVTNLIHRYNRKLGEFTLEMHLGEVTSDFGLPEWASRPRVSTPEGEKEAETEEVVEKVGRAREVSTQEEKDRLRRAAEDLERRREEEQRKRDYDLEQEIEKFKRLRPTVEPAPPAPTTPEIEEEKKAFRRKAKPPPPAPKPREPTPGEEFWRYM